VVVVINHEQEELSAMKVTTVGLDLAKNVFQVHGIDSTGKGIDTLTAAVARIRS